MLPFTWSWSRHRAFHRCRRAYWYDQYGARQGWRKPPGDRARALYELKTLLGRGQWVGQRVHEAAAWTIERWQAGDDVARDALRDDVSRRARREIDDARRGLHAIDPRRHAGFRVLHHDGDPGDAAWEDWVEELLGQVDAWWDHPVTRRLRETVDRIAEVEALRRLHVGHVPVWVSADVIVRDGRGGLAIVDWKTGRFHDDDVVDGQLAVYALYAQHRYRTPAHRIRGVHVSTRTGEHRTLEVDGSVVAAARGRIMASADEMAGLLTEPDRDQTNEADFPRLEEGSEACGHCAYQTVCWGKDQ